MPRVGISSGRSGRGGVLRRRPGPRLIRKTKQFTLWLPSRPGVLGGVAAALWEKQINIQALHASDVRRGWGWIHLVVDKPTRARKVLAAHGWKVSEDEIVVLTLPDKPGSLAAVAVKLGKAGINIQHAYSGPARARGMVNTYLAVSDLRGALKVLRV